MLNNTLKTTLLLLFCVMLSGCYETTKVVFHEPGEYRGASDTLQRDDAALQQRMDNLQDR